MLALSQPGFGTTTIVASYPLSRLIYWHYNSIINHFLQCSFGFSMKGKSYRSWYMNSKWLAILLKSNTVFSIK